jgi:type IV secretory pathway VirB3-like protein
MMMKMMMKMMMMMMKMMMLMMLMLMMMSVPVECYDVLQASVEDDDDAADLLLYCVQQLIGALSLNGKMWTTTTSQ